MHSRPSGRLRPILLTSGRSTLRLKWWVPELPPSGSLKIEEVLKSDFFSPKYCASAIQKAHSSRQVPLSPDFRRYLHMKPKKHGFRFRLPAGAFGFRGFPPLVIYGN